MPRNTYLVGVGVLAVLATGAFVPTAFATENQDGTAPADTTSAVERARVDAVPTPKLDWQPCRDGAECATVQVPLDYDVPQGASTELAVLRLRARKPEQRIGSLFLNPGGPSGSATKAVAAGEFDAVLLDRFDVVGFDPRGVGSSGKLRCFPSAAAQSVMTPLFDIAPADAQQEAEVIKAARAEGAACADHELAAAMSTAQAARDMDVLRRAVGDDKLTYLGFSYGTVIGQTYANMFPDRFRAIAADGVVDPVAWAGTAQTAGQPLGERLGTAAAQSEAVQEILRRCAEAGPERCALADGGDPAQRFAAITDRLRRGPVEVADGDETRTMDYFGFGSDLVGALYGRSAADDVVALLSAVWTAVQRDRPTATPSPIADVASSPGRADIPYDSTVDIVSAVTCSDGRHPATVASWPALAAEAERRTPVFGALAAWGSVPCAGDVWKALDEDAYHGPFDRRTAAPVLFVGSRWDPATTYREAVAASRLLPNSRLLTSTNWGHLATGTSACVTDAVNAYLIDGTLPAEGTVCEGDEQPFD